MVNKKAVSEVVAYVLLISVSLTIAGSVYIWLKGYVPNENSDNIVCEDDIALIINNYSCSSGTLSLTLQNKGLFDVDGYIIRVSNQTDASIGIYTINKTGRAIDVGTRVLDVYSQIKTDAVPSQIVSGNLYLVEVQPAVLRKNKLVYCSNFVSKQSLSC